MSEHKKALEKCVSISFGDRFSGAEMSTPISALDVDSLDLLEFVMAIEEEFGVEIEADLVDLNKGLDQFLGIVEELTTEPGAV